MKPTNVDDIGPLVQRYVKVIFTGRKSRRHITISGVMIEPNRERGWIRIILGIYQNFDGQPIARVYSIHVESIFDITLSSS